ncbi:MAG: hypothetical protein ROR55_04545 [Devosia sp.]
MNPILDGLSAIEQMVPAHWRRLDHANVAAIGRFMGGQTVGMRRGAQLTETKRHADRDVSVTVPQSKWVCCWHLAAMAATNSARLRA